MQDHTLSAFDDQLRHLADEIRQMGQLTLQQATDAFDALLTLDEGKARAVIAGDRPIDEKQHLIEQKAVLTIAKNQPMAIDLREIVAAIRVSNDLERIGDLAKNIAKRTIAIKDSAPHPELLTGIRQLSTLVTSQLDAVLSAYQDRDGDTGAAIRLKDRDIDALHTTVFRELLTYMLEDTKNIRICTHLLFCAKNIERIGDHVTNLAETIHYIETGELMEDDRPKADTSSASG